MPFVPRRGQIFRDPELVLREADFLNPEVQSQRVSDLNFSMVLDGRNYNVDWIGTISQTSEKIFIVETNENMMLIPVITLAIERRSISFRIEEDPTVSTPGTTIPVENSKREGSIVPAPVIVTEDPTGFLNGSNLRGFKVFGGVNAGTEVKLPINLITKTNSLYAVRLVNNSNSDIEAALSIPLNAI